MDRRAFLTGAVALAVGGACAQGITPKAARAASTQNTGGKRMKILVITGSPRKNGNSNTLASEFIRGASEAGHSVQRFDAGNAEVHPCIPCNSCGMDGPCVFEDDFLKVREHVIDADMVVFATPMYYFGFSAQLKAVIDRFYAINGKIHVHKKAALLMTYADSADRKARPIKAHYEELLHYLGWEDAGQVIAPGVWTEGSVKGTEYPRKAYELGRRV